MQQVDRMKNLAHHLPNGDESLAMSFIAQRDFESLQELVDSAIFKAKKSLKSDNPKREYLELDMDELTRLKAEVDCYVEQLTLPNNEEGDDYEEEYY